MGESMKAKRKAVPPKKRQAAIDRKTTETKISLKLVVEAAGDTKSKRVFALRPPCSSVHTAWSV